MRCYICEQEIGELGEVVKATHILQCDNHVVPITHKYGAMMHNLLRVIFYVNIEDKEYEVMLKPMEERTEINLIRRFAGQITFQNRTGKGFSIPITVKNFNELIEITPENAVSKIQTIITFS